MADADNYSRAVILSETGGPAVLRLSRSLVPELRTGQLLVRNHAAGVNAVDLLIRRGELPVGAMPALPHVLGVEGAGVVEAIGNGVESFAVGDRVMWFGFFGAGGYGSLTAIDARYVAHIGNTVDFKAAAGAPVIYATATHMLEDYCALTPGDWVLVRSAAGGVGSAVLQLARNKGLHAIAVTSSGKREFVLAQGAVAAIDYHTEDVAARVREITGGAGLALSLNPTGGDTVAQDLGLLKPFGQLVSFGFLSGLPEGRISEVLLPHYRKSLGLRMSDIYTLYHAEPLKMGARLRRIAASLAEGDIKPAVFAALPLAQAGRAHELLESSQSHGKLVLTHSDT